MTAIKGWVDNCSCGKCGKCRGEEQSAAEALFHGHQESGFSGPGGPDKHNSHRFKEIIGRARFDDPGPASRDKSGPNVHSEGRDAKKGHHGSPAPGDQHTGGIIRGS